MTMSWEMQGSVVQYILIAIYVFMTFRLIVGMLVCVFKELPINHKRVAIEIIIVLVVALFAQSDMKISFNIQPNDVTADKTVI